MKTNRWILVLVIATSLGLALVVATKVKVQQDVRGGASADDLRPAPERTPLEAVSASGERATSPSALDSDATTDTPESNTYASSIGPGFSELAHAMLSGTARFDDVLGFALDSLQDVAVDATAIEIGVLGDVTIPMTNSHGSEVRLTILPTKPGGGEKYRLSIFGPAPSGAPYDDQDVERTKIELNYGLTDGAVTSVGVLSHSALKPTSDFLAHIGPRESVVVGGHIKVLTDSTKWMPLELRVPHDAKGHPSGIEQSFGEYQPVAPASVSNPRVDQVLDLLQAIEQAH